MSQATTVGIRNRNCSLRGSSIIAVGYSRDSKKALSATARIDNRQSRLQQCVVILNFRWSLWLDPSKNTNNFTIQKIDILSVSKSGSQIQYSRVNPWKYRSQKLSRSCPFKSKLVPTQRAHLCLQAAEKINKQRRTRNFGLFWSFFRYRIFF
jgi:hypothetical protein